MSSEDQTGLVAEVFVEKGVFKKKKEKKQICFSTSSLSLLCVVATPPAAACRSVTWN